MSAPYIPPTHVEPEAGAPTPADRFDPRPAERIDTGDYILRGGKVWRVKAIQTHGITPRLTFTLYPTAGGRPESEVYFRREWLPMIKGQVTL